MKNDYFTVLDHIHGHMVSSHGVFGPAWVMFGKTF